MSEGSTPRSPRDRIGDLAYFPRMVEKVRLHAQGRLHADYVEKMGAGFDKACCHFLGVEYGDLRALVEDGADDGETLKWALAAGLNRSEKDQKIWSTFLEKRGWRDEVSDILVERKIDLGLQDRDEVQTFFDFIDADEGRL